MLHRVRHDLDQPRIQRPVGSLQIGNQPAHPFLTLFVIADAAEA